MTPPATQAGSSATASTTTASRTPDPASLPAAQRARRDRIVQAAIELLGAAEYEAVQMRDVADHAGVALGTLYRYFSSKEHLYAAAVVEWSSSYGPRRPSSADESDTVEQRLRSLMRRAVRAFEKSPQMFRAQMVIERSTDENARALYDEFGSQNTAVLNDALADLEPATAKAVINTVNCVMINHLRAWAHGRSTLRDVDRALQDTIGLIFSAPPSAAPKKRR